MLLSLARAFSPTLSERASCERYSAIPLALLTCAYAMLLDPLARSCISLHACLPCLRSSCYHRQPAKPVLCARRQARSNRQGNQGSVPLTSACTASRCQQSSKSATATAATCRHRLLPARSAPFFFTKAANQVTVHSARRFPAAIRNPAVHAAAQRLHDAHEHEQARRARCVAGHGEERERREEAVAHACLCLCLLPVSKCRPGTGGIVWHVILCPRSTRCRCTE